MSTVAIVMATYNGTQYVAEQIDSILASCYQDFELFIYDDGSKDDTMSILKEYESRYSEKIHVFCNERNLGVTMNFLQALRRSTMDYVMFCDQDDVWKPNKITVTLNRMRRMEAQLDKATPLAVFTDAVVVDEKLKVLKNSFFCSNHLNPRRTDLAHILMENKLIGCTVMVNCALRKVLQEAQLPTCARYHDWWVALIAASLGRIGYLNEATILYRQHQGNVVGGADFVTYMKSRVATLYKQKESIHALCKQADEFITIYQPIVPEDKIELIRMFADLEHYNFIQKRCIVLHNGFLKTGMIRNIGLLFIL